MSDPVFLDVDDVLLIHEEQLARYGGSAGLRDTGLLESAVAMPRATAGGEFAHQDLFAMAAAYAFHIAQNQPFIDGNKRTGLLAAIVFLNLNGVAITDPNGRLYDGMVAVADRRVDKPGLGHSSKTWRSLGLEPDNTLHGRCDGRVMVRRLRIGTLRESPCSFSCSDSTQTTWNEEATASSGQRPPSRH